MKNFLRGKRWPFVNSTIASKIPVSKIPTFHTTTRDPFRRSLIHILWLLIGVGLTLIVFGSPALWVSERWNGKGNPVFHECTYFNLFTGFERLEFRFHDGNCPIVRGFWIGELAPLYDLFHKT